MIKIKSNTLAAAKAAVCERGIALYGMFDFFFSLSFFKSSMNVCLFHVLLSVSEAGISLYNAN